MNRKQTLCWIELKRYRLLFKRDKQAFYDKIDAMSKSVRNYLQCD